MISQHVSPPMAASRMFEVSKRFPYTPRRFQRKTVALANRQEPQPSHHAPRTRHRNLQQSAPKSKPRPPTCQQESPHPGRFRQGEPAGSRLPRPPAANELLPKRKACVRCQWQKCKTASDLKHMSLRIAYTGESAFVPRLHTALGPKRLNALDSERVQTPDEGPSRTSVSTAWV